LSKRKEIVILLISDFVFINLAWTVYYYVRIETGWIPYTTPTSFLIPLLVVYVYWLIIFSFSGLYQHWFIRSRFDEFSAVFKTMAIGCLILFFVIFIDDTLKGTKVISRLLILIYWFLLVFTVGSGRIIIRSFQMNLLQKGVGLRNSVIIGSGRRARELHDMVQKYPQLGYKISGFIGLKEKMSEKEKLLGSLSEIPEITARYAVTDALIALEAKDKVKLLEVIRSCAQVKIHLKILPDTYEIVSGMAKTNQIYGVPLIEVLPEIMSYSQKLAKRVIDVAVSILTLTILSPVLILFAVLIALTSKGGLFYKQSRVGRNGKIFTMYKFRSMIKNAEEYGPEWAGSKDPRITKIGRILRKTYLDEVPQMINVLRNEMSLVGPRPERPHFVEMLTKEIPYYYKRQSIKPGITGWAQVKHKYDASLDDVRVKLQYDFYYIENMSLKLDFKIIINTLLVIIFMKGH
jgi:exopolysaccharide biosynthesis polyprenyl glycosylphosphotransferase